MKLNSRENITIPQELLISFAKAMVPEIKAFYQSEAGNAYYLQWLRQSPRQECPDAQSGVSGHSA